MSLTDSRRMWRLAAERGRAGLHSHDARKLGLTGNPSQRAKDIADHVAFWTKRESRNGRPGSRYWTDGTQPPDAIPVKPNRDVEPSDEAEGGRTGPAERAQIDSGVAAGPGAYGTNRSVRRGSNDECDRSPESSRPVAGLNTTASSDTPERDGTSLPGTASLGSVEAVEEQVGVKEPVALCRDYTRADGRWREVPVSQLNSWTEAA